MRLLLSLFSNCIVFFSAISTQTRLVPRKVLDDPIDILDMWVTVTSEQEGMLPIPKELEQSRDLLQCSIEYLKTSVSEPCKEYAQMNTPAKDDKRIVAKKCFSDRLISFNAVGKSNVDGFKYAIQNSTLQRASNKMKAESDFLICYEDAPHFQMTITDMIMEDNNFIAKILKIVVDKLMDNYERAGPERNSALEDLRRHFVSLKGMICFTKAMIMNGCHKQ